MTFTVDLTIAHTMKAANRHGASFHSVHFFSCFSWRPAPIFEPPDIDYDIGSNQRCCAHYLPEPGTEDGEDQHAVH
jgi:hypothetical protein